MGFYGYVQAPDSLLRLGRAGVMTAENFQQSFDAQVWAKAFVAIVKKNPAVAVDEGTMIGWFANALMRGWDERERRLDTSGGI